MCLNNSRTFRARVWFALGGAALFIRTSLEKTGLWRPLLGFLSSSVGVTAAKLIGTPPFRAHHLDHSYFMSDSDDPADGMAVLTASLLILDAGLTMLEAHRGPRTPRDAESEDGDESTASDPSVEAAKVYKPFLITSIAFLTIPLIEQNVSTTRKPHYDVHAPPISLAYLRSPLRPFGMPFLNFSSTHRDAVARALDSPRSPRSPAGSEFGDSLLSFGSGSMRSAGSAVSGGDRDAAILRAALAASLA